MKTDALPASFSWVIWFFRSRQAKRWGSTELACLFVRMGLFYIRVHLYISRHGWKCSSLGCCCANGRVGGSSGSGCYTVGRNMSHCWRMTSARKRTAICSSRLKSYFCIVAAFRVSGEKWGVVDKEGAIGGDSWPYFGRVTKVLEAGSAIKTKAKTLTKVIRSFSDECK